MNSQTHHPVILVLGKRKASGDEVDEWLASSPYSTTEALDVFQALERVSDFTVETSPDVVVLHVDSLEVEAAMLENMLGGGGCKLASVLAFDKTAPNAKGDRDLNCLARELDLLITNEASVH